ncbi:MAG: hypothetical protein ACI9TV_001442 [Sulfurimonas sp.]|jgi:hypothetical protein|uniref:hypothetical protein n=1 Tax=Sulfurimonas sp. TaxID=2022749 RepID=UPI0039E4FE06
MTHLQEAFLSELKSKEKLTVVEYANLYKKYSKLAIEEEEKNGASRHQAKAMGNYYTVTVLSDFVASENKLARIIALHESKK